MSGVGKAGPRRGKGAVSHALTPPIKKHIQATHKKQIADTEPYHKEDAERWSKKQKWEQLQDEFEDKLRDKGRYRYPTIIEFAQQKSKGNHKFERWLIKSIGTKPMKEITWRGDWALERAFNHSNESIAVRKIEQKLKEDKDIMKMTLPVAASIESWKLNIDDMRMKVMEVLGGELVEERPEKFKNREERDAWEDRQKERLNWFQTWMERLFNYKEHVDNLYLKALGIDLLPKNSNNMQAMIARIMTTKGIQLPPGMAGQLTDGNQSSSQQGQYEAEVWRQVITAEITKSSNFNMPLPDEYEPIKKVMAKGNVYEAEAVGKDE